MRRGDLVTAALTGDYGKPRPVVVIQSDDFDDSETVLICQLTSDQRNLLFRRISVDPTPSNGLEKRSQIMVEKIFAVRRAKCSEVIGRLDGVTMARLNEALFTVMGLAD